jgi:hypothetical protein
MIQAFINTLLEVLTGLAATGVVSLDSLLDGDSR